MKALGIIRKLDELGRVVVPKEVRDTQGWGPKQPLEMFMKDESLIIRPYGKEEEKQKVLEELDTLKAKLSGESNQTIQRVIDYVEQ